MSTGTGIFLAGLIIGLVMLYGQTKDRWDWKKISYYFCIAIGIIAITIYHALNDWKAFQYEWSIKGFITGFITYFALLVISYSPSYFASEFYLKVLDKSFQYDEVGDERTIYKIFITISCALLVVLVFFFADPVRETIHTWIYG